MYTQLNIEIRPKGALDDYQMDHFTKKGRKIVEAFHEEFQPYIVRGRQRWTYKLTSRDEKYDAFWEFWEKHKEEFDIVVYGGTIHEKEDLEAADAFMLVFRKQCYYYDEAECLEVVSPALGQWQLKPPILIQLPTNTKKAFRKGMAGANTPDFESYISPQLYEYLIEKGIGKEFFRPAYAKRSREEPVAWRLWGGDHVLPPESLMPFGNPEDQVWLQDLDTGYVKWVCNEDGDLTEGDYDDEYEEDMFNEFNADTFNAEDVIYDYDDDDDEDDMPDWKFYLNGEFETYRKTLRKEGIAQLAYVNDGYECIGNIRPTIVNKELFWLIAEKVSTVKRFSHPIFFSDHPKGGYKKMGCREPNPYPQE